MIVMIFAYRGQHNASRPQLRILRVPGEQAWAVPSFGIRALIPLLVKNVLLFWERGSNPQLVRMKIAA
jgi:hypothetical protein